MYRSFEYPEVYVQNNQMLYMINCCIAVTLCALMKHILMKQMFCLLRCSDLTIHILSTDVIVVRMVEVF